MLLAALGWSQVEPDPASAVAQAWANRPAVRAAQTKIAEAKAAKRAAGAFPTTTFNIGRGSDRAPGSTDADLSLVQPMDLFGRRHAAARSADVLVRQAEVELRAAKLGVQTEVLDAYNAVVASQRRLAVAQRLEEIAAKLKEAAQRKLDAGDVAEIQVMRANIALARAQQVAALRAGELQSAKMRLAAAIGGEQPPEVGAFFSLEEADFDQILLMRPDLMLLAGEVDHAEAQAREQALTNRPDLRLEVRRSPWTTSAEVGLRLQVSFPLFDHGRTRELVNAANLRREAARQQLDDAELLARADVAARQTELATLATYVTQLRGLLASSQELVTLAQLGFDQGALTMVETLEASRALSEVEESLVEAEYQHARASVALSASAGHLLEVNP